MMHQDSLYAKANLLHYGVKLDKAAKEEIKRGQYLTKRRVYSNYDDDSFLVSDVPPEIFFYDSKFPATAIYKNDSPWTITYENGAFFMKSDLLSDYCKEVFFLEKPKFYGKKTQTGELVESYVSKLFGHTLGVFASTSCYFADSNKTCKFCSIKANKGRPENACSRIKYENVIEAIEIALDADNDIDDIFISGGVVSNDFDKNFIWYCNLAKAISCSVKAKKNDISITLNTYPPHDLNLANELSGSDIAVMISIETISNELRKEICPGKATLFNSLGIEKIFKCFVEAVGFGKVLAFVIEGIEDEKTLIEGVKRFATIGVSIVVHVLHVDPGTWIEEQGIQAPLPEVIVETAKKVAKVYRDNNLDTSILYGGRSSLDGEASRTID